MLPLAAGVALSRVYNGVHYPSDVLVGSVLGAGTAVATVWGVAWFWDWLGRLGWNPWWSRMPGLLAPERTLIEPGSAVPQMSDAVWTRFAYLIVFALPESAHPAVIAMRVPKHRVDMAVGIERSNEFIPVLGRTGRKFF